MPHERALALLNAIYIAATTRENVPPLLLLIDFTEHLAPSSSGQATDFTLQLTEMLWMLAHEFRLRAHVLFMVFTGCRELIDSRVAAALPEVRLPQPNREDKLPFINALRDSELRRAATLEVGLDDHAD